MRMTQVFEDLGLILVGLPNGTMEVSDAFDEIVQARTYPGPCMLLQMQHAVGEGGLYRGGRRTVNICVH